MVSIEAKTKNEDAGNLEQNTQEVEDVIGAQDN